MRKYFLLLALAALMIWPTACTREDDNKGTSFVKLKMPDTSHLSKSVISYAVDPGGWSPTDPVTLGDILCYAVAVSGPEDVMSKYECTQVDGTVVMTPSLFGGPAVPGDTLSMEIPSGSARTFHIIGFGANSLSDCLGFTLTGIPLRENLSAPHLIGEKTVDLVPGEVDINVDISMTNAVKFNQCSGPFLNPDPAEILISEDPEYDFGDKATGSFTDKTFTLTNDGGSLASNLSEIGLAAPYSLKGGSWPGTGGTCTEDLGSSLTCTIVVTYAPTVSGTPTDSIIIQYNDGYNTATATRNLRAIASAPAQLSISGSPTYNFGSTTIISTSIDNTFTVSNIGDYTATSITTSGLAAPFTFKGGTYPGIGGDCGASLAPSATCTIVLTYSPVADVTDTDTLQFDYIDGAFPASSTINVTGNGATVANLTVTGVPPYDYASRANGSTTSVSFTINNTGETTATAMTGNLTTGTHFDFVGGTYPGGGTCGTTLVGGASCTVIVNFIPSSLGLLTDSFNINYNDGLVGQSTNHGIQGTSITPAHLSISATPDSFNYGNVTVGNTLSHSFTITNSGAATATGMAGVLTTGTHFDFVGGTYPGGGTCAASLAGGASCTIFVVYAPLAQAGHADTIQINYNDGAAAQNATAALSGTGLNPANITLTEVDPYDFGSVVQGNTANHIFTLTNTGGVTATGITETGLAAPFTFTGGTFPGTLGTCGLTLNAAATCDIDIQYAPVGTGISSDTIVINYNNGVSATTSNRQIQGTGITPALLTFSGVGTYDYGSTPALTPVTAVFTINNTGAAAATTLTETTLSPPYTFTGGSYPGTLGTCLGTLNSGSNCTIDVEFNPAGTGVYPATITIQYNDGASTQNATKAITGSSP